MVKEEFSRALGQFFELSNNKNTTYKNLWDSVKAVLREKFVALAS